MFPSLRTALRLSASLASDAATLGHATLPCKVALIENDFAEGNHLLASDLTKCAVAGLTPITCVTGTQNESIDPLTGELVVSMKVPAGGWRWECTDAVGLPKDIFGYALFDNAGTALYGATRFPQKRVISAVGHEVTTEEVAFRIDPTKMR